MVIIVSSFGATKNYPDQVMMRLTIGAFLNSLFNQTDPDWRLFISCHDKPDVAGVDDPRIVWCSMRVEEDCEQTLIPVTSPKTLDEQVEYIVAPYNCKLTDMSRKTLNSVIEAGRWVYREKIKSFWMLRMDSDDLLAKYMVEKLNGLNPRDFRAVYTRTCHIYDPRNGEIGVHEYPYSLTCNALYYELVGEKLIPDWYYHNNDHTTFMKSVQSDGIPALEMDFTLCIITNSGNSISDRPGIDQEKHSRKIEMNDQIRERYGLESFC